MICPKLKDTYWSCTISNANKCDKCSVYV